MTEPTPSTVMQIESLARTATASVVVPPIADVDARVDRRRTSRRRRRWSVAVVGAAAAVVVALVIARGGRPVAVRTTDGGRSTPTQHALMMPTTWPATVDGSITTSRLVGPKEPPSQLLAFHDNPIVAALLSGGPRPLRPSNESQIMPFMLGEHSAVLARDGDQSVLTMNTVPRDNLVLTTRIVDEKVLESLAGMYDPVSTSFQLIPDGFTVIADPGGLAELLTMAQPAGWDVARRPGRLAAMDVGTRLVDDAAGVVNQFRALMGHDGTEVPDLHGVLGSTTNTGETRALLVWAPSPHVVAYASGNDLDAAAIEEAAASVRPVTATEWNAHNVPVRHVDGFELDAREAPVTTGRSGATRWMVTTTPQSPDESSPGPLISVGLHVLWPDGTEMHQGIGSSEDGLRGLGPQLWTDRPGVAVYAFGPKGLTDAQFHLENRTLDGTVVDIPHTDLSLVFGIVVGDADSALDPLSSMSAQLPNGERYQTPNAQLPNGG